MRLLLLLLVLPCSLNADPARRDRFGDPLPDGALQRLGTARLKHPDLSRISVTEDGKHVVTVCIDYVRIWSATTGKLLRVSAIPGDRSCFRRVSETGDRAVVFRDQHLEVWHLPTSKRIHRLPLPGVDLLTSAAFHPSRDEVATFDYTPREYRLRIWNLRDGSNRVHGASEVDLYGLTYLDSDHLLSERPWPNGPSFLSALKQLDHIVELPGKAARVTAVLNHRLGLLPLVDPEAKLWKVLRIRDLSVIESHPLPKDCKEITFSPDGTVAAMSYPNRIEVVSHPAGKRILSWPIPENSPAASLAFSADSKSIFVFGTGLQKFDLQTRAPLFAPVDTETIAPPERLIWTLDSSGLLVAQSSGARVTFWQPHGRQARVGWSNADQAMLATTAKRTVSFESFPPLTIRITEGDKIEKLRVDSENSLLGSLEPRALGIRPDGNRLLVFLSRTEGAVFAEFDLESRRRIHFHELDETHFHRLRGCEEFSSDGSKFRFVNRLYHMPESSPFPLGVGLNPLGIESVAMNFDAAFYAGPVTRALPTVEKMGIANPFSTDLVVWETITGHEVARLSNQLSKTLAVDPSGRYLAIARPQGIELWDAYESRLLRTLPSAQQLPGSPEKSDTRCLAFSPDGKMLASGHDDTTVLIWDTSDLVDPLPENRDEATLDKLFQQLREPDARIAYSAVRQLIASRETALPYLARHLRPIRKDPPEITDPLLKQLRSERFRVREAAMKTINELDDGILDTLDDWLKLDLDEDLRKRILSLPEQRRWNFPPTGEDLRVIRSLRVLEAIHSPKSLELVELLADGFPRARATQEALITRERMRHRTHRSK